MPTSSEDSSPTKASQLAKKAAIKEALINNRLVRVNKMETTPFSTGKPGTKRSISDSQRISAALLGEAEAAMKQNRSGALLEANSEQSSGSNISSSTSNRHEQWSHPRVRAENTTNEVVNTPLVELRKRFLEKGAKKRVINEATASQEQTRIKQRTLKEASRHPLDAQETQYVYPPSESEDGLLRGDATIHGAPTGSSPTKSRGGSRQSSI